MIRCIAIDDEPLALEQLKTYIGKIPFLQLEAACQDTFEATKVLSEKTVDALFLDINMPDLNGLDFIRSLTDPPLVVFTTAYSEYAVEGYKIDAIDYLLKPFGLDEFQRAANKIKKQLELISPVGKEPAGETDDTLFLKSDYRIVKIHIPSIRYIESMSEYLRIYLENEAKPLIILLSLKKLEERLPKDLFMRVHRSYIVNLKKIQEISRLRIIMDKDTYIPISDLYREKFFQYIQDKFISK